MLRLLVGLLVCTALLLPQTVLAKSKIDMARDYVKIERFSEASQLLDELILDDPLNATIHYKAALIYEQMGDYRQADRAFRNAAKLGNYGPKIAKSYKEIGYTAIRSGQMREAQRAFNKATSYDPALSNKLAENLYYDGENAASAGNIAAANNYFTIACGMNKAYLKQVSNLYFDLGKKSTGQVMLNFFAATQKYSSHNNWNIGHYLAGLVKSGNLGATESKKLKKEAKNYLGKDAYSKEFPVVWEQVGETKTFVGKGMKHEDYILTIKCGSDFEIGDKIIVTGKNAKVIMFSRQNKLINGSFSAIIKFSSPGDAIGVRAPKGEKFYLTVKRLK